MGMGEGHASELSPSLLQEFFVIALQRDQLWWCGGGVNCSQIDLACGAQPKARSAVRLQWLGTARAPVEEDASVTAAHCRPGNAPDAPIVGNRITKADWAKLKAGLVAAPVSYAERHDPSGAADHSVTLDKPALKFGQAGASCIFDGRIREGGHAGDKSWRREVVDIARQNLQACPPNCIA